MAPFEVARNARVLPPTHTFLKKNGLTIKILNKNSKHEKKLKHFWALEKSKKKLVQENSWDSKKSKIISVQENLKKSITKEKLKIKLSKEKV